MSRKLLNLRRAKADRSLKLERRIERIGKQTIRAYAEWNNLSNKIFHDTLETIKENNEIYRK